MVFSFFFQEKVCFFFTHKFAFFLRFDRSFFIQVQFISFVKRKANSTIEQQKCKGHEKRGRLLVSKVDLNYQISERSKKKLTYRYPVFSNWVNLIKKY